MENAVLRVFSFLRLVGGERIWCHGDGWGVRGRRQFSLLIIAQPLWPLSLPPFPPLSPPPLLLPPPFIPLFSLHPCHMYLPEPFPLYIHRVIQLTQVCWILQFSKLTSGMFIPDPCLWFFPSRIMNPNPGSRAKKAPGPGSATLLEPDLSCAEIKIVCVQNDSMPIQRTNLTALAWQSRSCEP